MLPEVVAPWFCEDKASPGRLQSRVVTFLERMEIKFEMIKPPAARGSLNENGRWGEVEGGQKIRHAEVQLLH